MPAWWSQHEINAAECILQCSIASVLRQEPTRHFGVRCRPDVSRESLSSERVGGEGGGSVELDGRVTVHEPLFLVAFRDGQERVLGLHSRRERALPLLERGGGLGLQLVLLGVGGDDVFGGSVGEWKKKLKTDGMETDKLTIKPISVSFGTIKNQIKREIN